MVSGATSSKCFLSEWDMITERREVIIIFLYINVYKLYCLFTAVLYKTCLNHGGLNNTSMFESVLNIIHTTMAFLNVHKKRLTKNPAHHY
jgi:hypothetical protein